MSLKDKLFGFHGRVRRQDWWVLGILVYVMQSLTQFGTARLLGFEGYAPAGEPYPVVGDPSPVLFHSVSITLLFVWPQLALTAKRAHDIGRGSWTFVLAWVATGALAYWPIQNFAIIDPVLRQADLWSRMEPWVVMGVALAGLLYVFIPLGFIDGRPGPNRFGPSPKSGHRPVFNTAAGVK